MKISLDLDKQQLHDHLECCIDLGFTKEQIAEEAKKFAIANLQIHSTGDNLLKEVKSIADFEHQVDAFENIHNNSSNLYTVARNQHFRKTSRSAENPKERTFVYLVTLEEGGNRFWKWGITSKTSAKKRSHKYIDTHRWLEVDYRIDARHMETHIGSMLKAIALEDWGYGLGSESLPCRFPFEVLVHVVDHVYDYWTDSKTTEYDLWWQRPAHDWCEGLAFESALRTCKERSFLSNYLPSRLTLLSFRYGKDENDYEIYSERKEMRKQVINHYNSTPSKSSNQDMWE